MGRYSPSYSPHQEEAANLHPSPRGAGCNAPPLKGLVADSGCSCPILGEQLSEPGRDAQGKVVPALVTNRPWNFAAEGGLPPRKRVNRASRARPLQSRKSPVA
jgi:hypothetical protein